MQADACIACGLTQPLAQLFVEQCIAFELIGGGKGVHVGKLRPRNGNHLAGGIEFHGARAQRNHASVECQIFVTQLANVAQHARFGVVAIEHRVRQKVAGAAQTCWDEGVATFFERCPVGQCLSVFGKAGPQGFNVIARCGFVQRHGNAVGT